MTSNTNGSFSFPAIIENLEKLTKRAQNPSHGEKFQRQTLNHRVLADLEREIYKREASLQYISDSDLLMLKRATVFNWSSLQSSIDFFRWCRASTVEELAIQAYQSAKSNSLLASIMALRSILEIAGNAALLKRDLQQLAKPDDESAARMEWLGVFESIIDSRIAGVRVDYAGLINNGLRGAGKISYKPEDLKEDMTAKDLLKGVDVLDKRVKGARAAYEFFSEFAHPNLASVWTHYDRTEVKLKVLDIQCYLVHHQQRHVGTAFLETFGSVVAEGIDIVSDCLDELLEIDIFLKIEGETTSKYAKKAIRELIRRDPGAFDFRELCPCNSGKYIQQCCGKLIKVSKFGSFTAKAPLH